MRTIHERRCQWRLVIAFGAPRPWRKRRREQARNACATRRPVEGDRLRDGLPPFAIGLSVLGAGYAVGRIGSAALGLAAEKPELLTRSILFVALAEGLAVLGFAIAMMLVQKI